MGIKNCGSIKVSKTPKYISPQFYEVGGGVGVKIRPRIKVQKVYIPPARLRSGPDLRDLVQ